jgi:hypothetical protein
VRDDDHAPQTNPSSFDRMHVILHVRLHGYTRRSARTSG